MKIGQESSTLRGQTRRTWGVKRQGAKSRQDAGTEILTVEEVASYLRLKPQTIYKWAQGHRIPAAKLGKEWRFRRSILDRWLDEQMLGDPAFAHLRRGAEAVSRQGGAITPDH